MASSWLDENNRIRRQDFAELCTAPVRMQPVLAYAMSKAALVAKPARALAEVGTSDPTERHEAR